MAWVLDLDGVVWRGDEPIEGSADAIGRLRAAGIRVLYVTNNARHGSVGYVNKLAGIGVEADPGDIVHAGHAVAGLTRPGSKVLSCAGVGVAEALDGIAEVIDVATVGARPPKVDTVVIGIRNNFQYDWLSTAATAVLDGADLVAPSGDPLFPQPDGFKIGGGALVSAIEFATGAKATIAGKPSKTMADAVARRDDNVNVVVGDQARTDGRLAAQLGASFALVRSGVTSVAGRMGWDAADVPVSLEADDLAAVVDQLLSGPTR